MQSPQLPRPVRHRAALLPRCSPAVVACAAIVLAGPAPGQVNEDLKLLPGDGTAGARFGYSTAVSGGIVAVGAHHDDDNGGNSGSAYLFDAFAGTQLVKLLPTDGAAGDEFGFAIAIGDGVVAVGARWDDDHGPDSGSAYLFDAATGAQLAKLLPSDGAAGDEFGFDVAIDGGTVVVGAKRDDDNGADSGSVYLFDASTGAQLAKLLASDGAADDNFGEAVDLDEGVVVVGAHGDDDNGPLSGSAYLFDAFTGSQLDKLLPLDGAANNFFGSAVAIDAGVVAVGAWANSDNGDHSGTAYLFDAGTGNQTAKLTPSDNETRDHFGYAIDLDGGVVAIGAEQDNDSAFSAGSAYLFDASTGAQMTKILASDGAANDLFGSSIAIANGVVAVGAHADDDNGSASGSAYVVDSQGAGVGTRFCFGDGSGAACPCGNLGDPGHGCAGSAPEGSTLFASGSDSVAGDDLVLHARSSAPSQPGLFFQGSAAIAGGQGIVFGDGLRCAGMSVVRLETVVADASGQADSSTPVASTGSAQAGQTRYYQWWYRDPAGSPCGAGFNLSSALEILWAN